MKRTRRIGLTTLIALVALAVTVPVASAGWQIQTNAGNPYTGQLNVIPGVGSGEWTDDGGGTLLSCATYSMAGTVTNAGPATPAATLNSFSMGCNGTAPGIPPIAWSARNAPWSATVGTDTSGSAKLTIPSPQLWGDWAGACLPPFASSYQAAALSGRLTNDVTAGLTLTFDTSLGAVGLNNRVLRTQVGCWSQSVLRLRAIYRLRGVNGGNPVVLKIVSTP